MDKRAWACCRHSLRMLTSSPRLWALLILCLLCFDRYLAPITALATNEGLRIGWAGVSVFLLNDSWVGAMTTLGLLMLLFDVPRTDPAQKYLLLRSGRRAWAWGQLLYILCATAIYLAALGLILLAWIAPWFDWSLGWSSAIESFVGGADQIYDSMIAYDPWLVRVYSPIGALTLELVLHYICFVMLGFAMCLANGTLGNRAGFLIAAAPAMLDVVISEYFSEAANYFSPLTLTRLSCLDYGDGMLRPSVGYALIALTLLAVLLGWLCLRIYGRKEIRQ